VLAVIRAGLADISVSRSARDVGEIADTDFTVARLVHRPNGDLANALGNTANRLASLVHRKCSGRIDEQHAEPPPHLVSPDDAVTSAIAEFRLRDAAHLIVDATRTLNADLAATGPWCLATDPARRLELEQALTTQVAAVRAITADVASRP